MSKYCGFDTDKVGALQKAINDAVTGANTLSRSIAGNVGRANSIQASALGISPRNLEAEPSYDTDPDRAGLRTIGANAAGVASEIGRRLAHLKGCEQLAADGFTVDASSVFNDEPVPSEAKIKAAQQQFQTALSTNNMGDSDQLTKLINQVTGLTPAETEAFIGSLSDDQLRQLNVALSFPQVLSWGVSNDQRLALTNSLLSKLCGDQVQRIAANLPVVEPNTSGYDNNDINFTWVDSALYDGAPTADQLSQGEVGDCWFLSSINAELQQNPNFIQQHVKDNGNGTYTVTFYQKGKPVQVTVDGTVPTDSNGTRLPLTHGDPDWGTGGPLWATIYEKAYAQLNGGYHNIDGGYGSTGMSDLTGKKSTKVSPDFAPLSIVADQLSGGHPVTVGTNSHSTGMLWWKKNDEYVDDNKLVTSHEYAVVSVNASANPPTITLRNPWGPDSSAPQFVTLTQQQYDQYIGDVDFGDT
jgi:hypothetical protein